MGYSWGTPQKNKNKSETQKRVQKEQLKFKVGDDVIVTYDPTNGNHDTRGGVILEVLPNRYYLVNFTATSGATLDGEVRKPYERKNGKNVVLLNTKEKVHVDHLKEYKYNKDDV